MQSGAPGAVGVSNEAGGLPSDRGTNGSGGAGGAASLQCAGTLSAPSITVTQPTNGGAASANIGTLLVPSGGTTLTNNGGSVAIGTIQFDASSTSLIVTGAVGVTNVNLVPPATANGGATGFSATGLTSGTLSVDTSSLSLSVGEAIVLLASASGVPAAWDNLTFGAYTTKVSGNNLLLGSPATLAFNGPTGMTVTRGYAATQTGAYTITGLPPSAVTVTSSDSRFAWDGANNKLNIPAGLGIGTYRITLTASNVMATDVTLTFVLTVNDPANPPAVPQTGDGSHITPWILVMSASLCAIVVIHLFRKKKERAGRA